MEKCSLYYNPSATVIIIIFLSIGTILFSTGSFFISNQIDSLYVERQKQSDLLNKFIAKNDLVNEIKWIGYEPSPNLYAQGFLYLTQLKHELNCIIPDYTFAEQYFFAEINSNPKVIDDKNLEIASITEKIKSKQRERGWLFLLTIIFQVVSALFGALLHKITLSSNEKENLSNDSNR